ncbi:MAG: dihydroorotate dehydrogenase [Candidatus Diapherotrites archaeon CG10_big_fil_rev_8_21_14_0_10_31_34]|nr:MAG: dihydroorotate dehydrogenase [Candidatus Diapherotrites archaeon CG10_big_fil_rev_8_21_14_0_10_31_34]
MKPDLKIKNKVFDFRNPTVLPSGFYGEKFEEMQEIYNYGAGAVTLKSIGPREKKGHPHPIIAKTEHGFLNAVGLPSPGYKNMEELWQKMSKRKFPLIASIYGTTINEFAEVAEFVASKKPEIIELNISCPNVEKFGMPFGCDSKIAAQITEKVKNVSGKIPVMPKLTPQANDIAGIAKACEEAGADALTAINSVGPGMKLDLKTGKPLLSFKKGGYTGAAIKPIAVRCIYDVFDATEIPILGVGGVSNGKDAVELMMAGASAVGVGSVTYTRGKQCFSEITKEIEDWMIQNNVKKLDEIIGKAHK